MDSITVELLPGQVRNLKQAPFNISDGQGWSIQNIGENAVFYAILTNAPTQSQLPSAARNVITPLSSPLPWAQGEADERGIYVWSLQGSIITVNEA